MEKDNRDPLINKVAGVFDRIAEINRDFRVKNGTNNGGNQIYLRRYSYSNTAKVFLQLTVVVFLIAVILIVLNVLGMFPNSFWTIALGWGLIFLLVDIPYYFATIYRENIGKRLKTDKSSKKVFATVVKIKRGFFPGFV